MARSCPSAHAARLARAERAYARASRRLLAAEAAYAAALLALRRARADEDPPGPPPAPRRHFLCGHAGMASEERDDALVSLCPACRAWPASAPPPFTPQRTLLLREPQAADLAAPEHPPRHATCPANARVAASDDAAGAGAWAQRMEHRRGSRRHGRQS